MTGRAASQGRVTRTLTVLATGPLTTRDSRTMAMIVTAAVEPSSVIGARIARLPVGPPDWMNSSTAWSNPSVTSIVTRNPSRTTRRMPIALRTGVRGGVLTRAPRTAILFGFVCGVGSSVG